MSRQPRGPAERFVLRADVLVSGDDAVQYLTDLETGALFELNATAADAVDRLRRPASTDDLARHLAARHRDVDAATAARDAAALLDDLVARGLVRRE